MMSETGHGIERDEKPEGHPNFALALVLAQFCHLEAGLLLVVGLLYATKHPLFKQSTGCFLRVPLYHRCPEWSKAIRSRFICYFVFTDVRHNGETEYPRPEALSVWPETS